MGGWRQSGRVNFPHSHRKLLDKQNWKPRVRLPGPTWFPNVTMKDKSNQFWRHNPKERSQRGAVEQRHSWEEAFHTYFCELVIFEGYADGCLSVGLPTRWVPITILREGREQRHTVNHPEALWFVQEQKSCQKKVMANELRGGESPETSQKCASLDLLLQTPCFSMVMATAVWHWSILMGCRRHRYCARIALILSCIAWLQLSSLFLWKNTFAKHFFFICSNAVFEKSDDLMAATLHPLLLSLPLISLLYKGKWTLSAPCLLPQTKVCLGQMGYTSSAADGSGNSHP